MTTDTRYEVLKTKKKLDADDCRSPDDFIRYAVNQDEAHVHYLADGRVRIRGPKPGCMEVNNGSRDMSKDRRLWWKHMLHIIGLAVITLIVLGGYLVMQHPEIVAAVSAHAGG